VYLPRLRPSITDAFTTGLGKLMKYVVGETFWGKAAGVVGVAVAASGGVVAAVANGAHVRARGDGRRFKDGFSEKFAQVDLAAAAKDAADFGDARVAPAAEKAKPVVKKIAGTVATVLLTAAVGGAGGSSGA